MPPYFLTPERKKKNIFGEKFIRKKIQKNLMVNNNNKIIRAWYLSSKWPVCRSIVNQTTGGKSRIKLSTLLKTNIFKYCALFCKKVGKCSFVLFRSFFPFSWRAKLVIYYFFIILSHQQLRYAICGLETCCSCLGSIKYTYISMVKQTISTS